MRACSVVSVYRGPTPGSQPWAAGHWGQALSGEGPKAGVREWKVAEFSWPSLQARGTGKRPTPAGSQSGHRCGPRLSVCSTPAGGVGCHSGRRARFCSGPRKVPGGALQPGLRLESRAKGRAVHSFPLLGSPWGGEAQVSRCVRPGPTWSPHWGRPWETLSPGPQELGQLLLPSQGGGPGRHRNTAPSPTQSTGLTGELNFSGQCLKQRWTLLGT